jgi:hopanoid biosynthesis associated radical SAM protein HpnH
MALDAVVGRYLVGQTLRRRRRFPLVTMVEPIEACNFTCEGCGRIREYHDVLHLRLTADDCLAAVEASGAPIVSISGGEPLLHNGISEITEAIIADGRFAYLCTNGLLLRESLDRLRPSKRLAFVVHFDGTEATHDRITGHAGAYAEALAGVREAVARGHRVCSNTTLFHGSDVADLHSLFSTLTAAGVEGLMVSPGYSYSDVARENLFLLREEAIRVFRRVLDRSSGFPFYNNPLYLDFLRGERHYDCAAWTTPTFTVRGWRLPCYTLADRHAEAIEELYDDAVWSRYGPGRDPRCAHCMMHSAFEGASILSALRHPKELIALARGAWR